MGSTYNIRIIWIQGYVHVSPVVGIIKVSHKVGKVENKKVEFPSFFLSFLLLLTLLHIVTKPAEQG
jgi:hypothetical protein